MRPRRLMGNSCRPPIGWSQRGPGVRRPRVPSGLRETASPVPKCISSGVCPRKREGANARLRIWLARRGIRGYECSGCGRRTWQVRDVRLRTWDDQVACSRLDELCTISAQLFAEHQVTTGSHPSYRHEEPASPNTCITLLTGGLLVRIQPEEPISLGNLRTSSLPTTPNGHFVTYRVTSFFVNY